MSKRDYSPFNPGEKRVLREFTGELKSRINKTRKKAKYLPREPPKYAHKSISEIASQLRTYKKEIVRRKRKVGLGNNYSETRFGQIPPSERKIWHLIYDIASLVEVEGEITNRASSFPDLERVIEEIKFYIHPMMHEIESREREACGEGISIPDIEKI